MEIAFVVFHLYTNLIFPALRAWEDNLWKNRGSFWIRLPVAVAIPWILQILVRIAFEVPYYKEQAQAQGDYMYDGVGGNVAILFTGWIYPLIVFLACASIKKLTSKKPPNQSSHTTPASAPR